MKNIIKLCAVILLLSGTLSVQAQSNKTNSIDVKTVITDEDGIPVEGALVHIQNGFAKTKSDKNGYFTLKVNSDAVLTIEAKGLQTVSYEAAQLPSEIKMSGAPLYYEEESDVEIAYETVKRGDLINQVQVIRPEDNDGVVFNRDLTELVATSVAGLLGSNNMRGLGNALVVVDGVARYKSLSNVIVLPEEVESVSFLNSVSAAVLYGAEARNGVILITTKRGKSGTQTATVRAHYGVSVPKNLPQFLGSADYMTLYNEALVNDGLSPLYSAAEIANYRSGSNPYQYPDLDYYSSDYVKRFTTNSRIDAEFSGGSDNVTYYSNIGWNQGHDFINFGPAKNMASNRINARTNVNFKINDVISNTVIGSAVFDFDKYPRTDYFNMAATLRPNEYMPFLPIDLMDGNNPDIAAFIEGSNNVIDGKYLLGGSALRKTNPLGDIYAGGYNQNVARTMEFNNILKFDLNKFVEGLTASLNVNFDFYNSYLQNITTSYAVYEPTWENGEITNLTKFNEDKYTGVLYVGYASSARRFGFSGQVNYSRTFNRCHNFDAMVVVNARTYRSFVPNSSGQDGNKVSDNAANLGLRLAYNYQHKYYVDFSSSLSNSIKLAPGHRVGFSPTLAVAYDIKKEDFMQDISWLDYLKLSASAGILKSDLSIPGYYYYNNVYTGSGTYFWNEKNNSTASTLVSHSANPNLHMEKRKEFNIGFDALMLDRSLQMRVNYFNTTISDMIGKATQNNPTYLADIAKYDNNAGSDRYYGGEIGVNYIRKINDFKFNIGIAATIWDSKVISRRDHYAYDYLYRTGRPVAGLYMLEAEGLFGSQQEIDSSPRQTFGAVKPGDIKYKDQNGDGIINNNDVIYVGRGTTPVNLGLNVALSYKNFTLYANGNYVDGGYSSITGSYYRMSGTDKYSVIANERWTGATKDTAKYPRLTSLNASNNDQNSTFWLFKDRYFNLSRVQLNYNFSPSICRKLLLGDLNVYLLASDVVTVGTQNAYRNQSVGTLVTRSFAIGLNATF